MKELFIWSTNEFLQKKKESNDYGILRYNAILSVSYATPLAYFWASSFLNLTNQFNGRVTLNSVILNTSYSLVGDPAGSQRPCSSKMSIALNQADNPMSRFSTSWQTKGRCIIPDRVLMVLDLDLGYATNLNITTVDYNYMVVDPLANINIFYADVNMILTVSNL